MLVTKDFITMTDALIKQIKDKKITFGNGNVLIARYQAAEKSKGGIIIAEEARELENKRAGFAKVLALPNNMDVEGGDIPVKVGDYVWFVFVADSPINYKVLGEITDVKIPSETLFFTGDAQLIATVAKEEVEND